MTDDQVASVERHIKELGDELKQGIRELDGKIDGVLQWKEGFQARCEERKKSVDQTQKENRKRVIEIETKCASQLQKAAANQAHMAGSWKTVAAIILGAGAVAGVVQMIVGMVNK